MGKHIDVIEKRFGNLIIANEIRTKQNGKSTIFVECECDCGVKCTILKQHVLSGHTSSCGCKQDKTRKYFGKRISKPCGEAMAHSTFLAYKRSAKVRGYSFELEEKTFREIITKPCRYCGDRYTQCKKTTTSNGAFYYTGIDRLDNTVGYTKNNCVPCCAKCNRMKGVMSCQEFTNQVEKIFNMYKRTA